MSKVKVEDLLIVSPEIWAQGYWLSQIKGCRLHIRPDFRWQISISSPIFPKSPKNMDVPPLQGLDMEKSCLSTHPSLHLFLISSWCSPASARWRCRSPDWRASTLGRWRQCTPPSGLGCKYEIIKKYEYVKDYDTSTCTCSMPIDHLYVCGAPAHRSWG